MTTAHELGARAGRRPPGRPLRAAAVVLALASRAGAQAAPAAAAPPPRIVVVPSDHVPWESVGLGCSPEWGDSFDAWLARERPELRVRFDMRRVLQADVGPYRIYAKKHCPPIGRVLAADTFVMSRVTHVEGPLCEARNDLEVKAWTSRTDRGAVVFRASSIPDKGVDTATAGHEQEILDEIIALTVPAEASGP